MKLEINHIVSKASKRTHLHNVYYYHLPHYSSAVHCIKMFLLKNGQICAHEIITRAVGTKFDANRWRHLAYKI